MRGTARLTMTSSVGETFVQRLRAVPQKTVPLRAERKRMSGEIAAADRRAVLALARHLIENGIPRFVADELLMFHRPTFNALKASDVRALGRGVRSWGDVDAFACIIAGPCWRTGRIPDSLVRSWTRSRV